MPIATFTDGQRDLLARGYPHLALLETDHPDDDPHKIASATKRLVTATDPLYFVRWPAGVAARFVALYATQDREARAVNAKYAADPPARERLESFVVTAVTRGSVRHDHGYPFEMQAFLYLLEAWHGADAVASALAIAFEQLVEIERGRRAGASNERVPVENYAAQAACLPLAALLARASPGVALGVRARLEALVLREPELEKQVWALQSLDMVLFGKAGVARAGWTWAPPESWLFAGDPAWALDALRGAKGEVALDVRAVWVAGEDALEVFEGHVAKVARAAMAFATESFGMLRTPRVVPVMVGLARKKGGEQAIAWLLEHREVTWPTLEKLAGGKGPIAIKAGEIVGAAPPASSSAYLAVADDYDDLLDETATAMTRARGDAEKEARVLRAAARGYIEIRTANDDPPTEYMGHFFMVDGTENGDSLWARLDPSEEESARWAAILGELE